MTHHPDPTGLDEHFAYLRRTPSPAAVAFAMPIVGAFAAGAFVLGAAHRGWCKLTGWIVPDDVFVGGLSNEDIDAALPHEEEE